MPFTVDSDKCANCKYDRCMEDRRQGQTGASQSKFLLKLQVALACTFDDFVPGSDQDPLPKREYFVYLQQFKSNILNAGRYLFGDDFNLNPQAVAKLEDEIFEALEAAAFWNAAAVWNIFMDRGVWISPNLVAPPGAVPHVNGKIAIIRLPRDYDATLLFDEATRGELAEFERDLNGRDTELKLSCPDLVGIRLKPGEGNSQEIFHHKVSAFTAENIKLMENAYKTLEGSVAGRDFIFAVSVKKSIANHLFYQPLYEANVLKYLVQEVLHGNSFRFYLHVGTAEAASGDGPCKSASLYSLLKGGEPQRAIDKVYTSESPLGTAQAALDEFPHYCR